jgi:hypothetical protein
MQIVPFLLRLTLSFVGIRLVLGLELEARVDGTKEHLTVVDCVVSGMESKEMGHFSTRGGAYLILIQSL